MNINIFIQWHILRLGRLCCNNVEIDPRFRSHSFYYYYSSFVFSFYFVFFFLLSFFLRGGGGGDYLKFLGLRGGHPKILTKRSYPSQKTPPPPFPHKHERYLMSEVTWDEGHSDLKDPGKYHPTPPPIIRCYRGTIPIRRYSLFLNPGDKGFLYGIWK